MLLVSNTNNDLLESKTNFDLDNNLSVADQISNLTNATDSANSEFQTLEEELINEDSTSNDNIIFNPIDNEITVHTDTDNNLEDEVEYAIINDEIVNIVGNDNNGSRENNRDNIPHFDIVDESALILRQWMAQPR